jgi:tRNA dimethylallyltransferase
MCVMTNASEATGPRWPLPGQPAWLGLAGPTASGKTALALGLARQMAPQWPVEIISVDSALVYCGMDIGTAKPSPTEQAEVPHHLLDIIDPAASYSAAQFTRDATRLMGDIRARGRLPLLVGGTMLYFKALIDGLDELPTGDATVRATLDAEAAALGWPALHARLAEVDPTTAARLAPHDSQRIQRALEVWAMTGQSLSSFHTRGHAQAAAPQHLLIALEPPTRAWLHERIAQRCEAMWDQGFLAEVVRLRERPDLHLNLPAIRCVGYRQAWEALDQGLNGDTLRRHWLERSVPATRQLAKRQMTWLRSLPHVKFDLNQEGRIEPLLAQFNALLQAT